MKEMLTSVRVSYCTFAIVGACDYYFALSPACEFKRKSRIY